MYIIKEIKETSTHTHTPAAGHSLHSRIETIYLICILRENQSNCEVGRVHCGDRRAGSETTLDCGGHPWVWRCD